MTGLRRAPREFVPPRWGTERNEDRPTLGHEIDAVARRFIGKPLMPHQRYMADVIMEYTLDAEGRVRLEYTGWDAGTPRQSGKTIFSFSWLTQRATMMARRYGQMQQGLYVAQRGRDSAQKFEIDFCELLRGQSRNFVEVDRRPRNMKEWRYTSANGKENLRLGPKGILYPAAPTRDVGHSKTLDVVLIDEAFAFSLAEAALIEAGVVPTMATRASRQIGKISTAGDERSEFWWSTVLAGRNAIENNLDTPQAYFEWGVPDDVDPADEDAWWEFLPALGRTIDVDFLRAELQAVQRATDPEAAMDLFRRSYLNQWPRVPILGERERPKVIDEATWTSWADPASRIDGRRVFGVAVSPGGTSTSIVAAGHRADGLTHVELVQHDAGIWWAEKRLLELVAKWSPDGIGYDAGGPTRAIAPEIERAAGTVPVTKIDGRDYAAACQAFISSGRVRHTGMQQDLTLAARGAEARAVAGGWIWSWDSPVQIVTLVAATVAARTLERLPAPAASSEPFFMFS